MEELLVPARTNKSFVNKAMEEQLDFISSKKGTATQKCHEKLQEKSWGLILLFVAKHNIAVPDLCSLKSNFKNRIQTVSMFKSQMMPLLKALKMKKQTEHWEAHSVTLLQHQRTSRK